MTTRRVAAVIGSLAVSGAAMLLALAYHRPEPPAPTPAPGMTVGSDTITLVGGAPEWSVLEMKTAALAGPRWSEPLVAHVVFDEDRASRAGSPLAGRVQAIDVERGQHVLAGAPLFVIASTSLAELRATRERALVERTTARATLARTQALVDAESLPGKDLVTAKQKLDEAELALRAADEKLAALQISSAGGTSLTIRSPREGVVVETSLAVGQEIDSSGAAGMVIADLSEVWVVADVFESDLGGLAIGARARCKVVGNDGAEELDGVVAQISATVDPDRHTVPVRVKLANPGAALRPNAYAQVRFFDPAPATVVLPSAAVLAVGTLSYVYVNDHATLRRREVTAGAERHGEVPILSGVAAGEQIVTRGGILLENEIQLAN